MSDINNINITNEELQEIEEIVEIAKGCTTYFVESLVDMNTGEVLELNEEDEKEIYKLILNKTMEYIEINDFPQDDNTFGEYISFIYEYLQEIL